MSPGLTTRHRWFTRVRLLGSHLPPLTTAFPRRSPPWRIHQSSSWRFDTGTCMPISKGLPSSPQQHGHENHLLYIRLSRSLRDTLMRWPSRLSACSKPRRSERGVLSGRTRRRRWMTSSTRRWNGSTGTTTAGCTASSATSHPPSSKPPTTLNQRHSNRSLHQYEVGIEPETVHLLRNPPAGALRPPPGPLGAGR